MAVWFIPVALAIDRVDQCVASFGFSSKVFTITASTWSSVIVRVAPGRGASKSPSRRSATKRERHLPTMAPETPSSAATMALVAPVAHPSTMRQRMASAWALLRLVASRSKGRALFVGEHQCWFRPSHHCHVASHRHR